MEMLPLAFTSGWASGLNAYATVLVLGLLGRFAGLEQIPAGLQRTDVLVIAAILAAIELVADKIPYVDSLWDTPSTIVRPIAGATIGALMAGAHGDLATITLAAVGGVTALLAHLTKASTRLAVNTSPEPFTNIAVSSTENVAVVGLLTLAAAYPVPIAILTGVILLAGIVLAIYLAARVRRGLRRVRAWWDARRSAAPA
ncbi:DUF4126 domain-containing protein [Mariniluteicoccus flavus]